MGSLSSAIENVEYERHASEDIIATSAAMQGYRIDMEDHHTICLRLPNHPNHAFIGLYDGHSGSAASKFLSEKFWREIDLLTEITRSNLDDIVRTMDEHWSKDPRRAEGSTVLFAVIERPNDNSKFYKVLVGWGGDSRGIAVKDGKYEELTIDHKPSNPEEKARIENANGWVNNDRVDGELAVSRSFGDWNMKDDNNGTLKYHELKVTCVLEFKEIELKEGDCVLLSCDGLTEQLENTDIFDKLMELRKKHPKDADIVLDGLMQTAKHSGSKDNMSTILVEFREGGPFYESYRDRMRTCRPGPLAFNLNKNRFFDAYIKNIEAMGLKDCKELRRAAYLRDRRNAQDEYLGTRTKVEASPLENIITALVSDPSQLVLEESKEDENDADKQAKRDKKLEQIQKAEDLLETTNFSFVEEPKKAPYSAFNDIELLLTPDHEYYMAFNRKNADSDEKNMLSLDENETGAWNCIEAKYSIGESVTVVEDRSILEKECEKLGIAFNEKRLQCVGKQGRVVIVTGKRANVCFGNIGEIYFPVTAIRPLVILSYEVKQLLEQVCKEITEEANSNKMMSKSMHWGLTLSHVRELLGIIYPKMNNREIAEHTMHWKEAYGIHQAGLFTALSQIQAKDKDELNTITAMMKEFLSTKQCKVQIGMNDDMHALYVPVEKTTLLDIAERVSERLECDLNSVFLTLEDSGAGKRYTSENALKDIKLAKVVEPLLNKKIKIYAGLSNAKKKEGNEDLKLDDRD